MERTLFEHAAVRYQNMVYRIALHYFGNSQDAEDAVQEVFLRLYTAEKSFESPEHLRRWLIRVAVNQSRKLIRSPWFRRRAPLEAWSGTAELPAPEESRLFLAVMALPEKYRVPLYLYYYEDYPVREVAALCGLKESTVQTRLQRAREKLKQTLTTQEEDS